MKKLTMLLPVFNNYRLTANCLASIFKSTVPKEDYDIIIVDNASTDRTSTLLSYLKECGEPITIITNTENKGYLLAMNQAWKLVKTPYALMLNNDIVLHKDCIQRLFESFSDPEVGMSGGVGYNDDGTFMLPPLWYVDKEKVDMVHKNIPVGIPEIVTVDVSQIACTLVKKEVWEKIGFYDERFVPCFFEEVDYCLTAKANGFKVVTNLGAKFIHYLGSTTASNPSYFNSILNINREKFKAKWRGKLP